MKENTTSPEEIARLRSDLDTIQTAIGDSLPFEKNDIRFCWAVAGSLLLCVILNRLGFNEGKEHYVAIIPLLLTATAYFVYMAMRSRRRTEATPTIKKEYRLAVIVMFILIISLPLFKKWAIAQGFDARTFDAVNVITLGIAAIAMSFLPFTAHRAFRRISIGSAGAMMVVIGLFVPSLTRETHIPTLCAIGVVGVVIQALTMQYFLKRQEQQSDPTTNGQ